MAKMPRPVFQKAAVKSCDVQACLAHCGAVTGARAGVLPASTRGLNEMKGKITAPQCAKRACPSHDFTAAFWKTGLGIFAIIGLAFLPL